MCSPLTPERAGERGGWGGGLRPWLRPLLLPVLLYELHELFIKFFCAASLCKLLYALC